MYRVMDISMMDLENPGTIYEFMNRCNELNANDILDIYNYGKNGNLKLRIVKDSNFDRNVDDEAYNIVAISVYKQGEDGENNILLNYTKDLYVFDNEFPFKLVSIWNEDL